jgi:hypothetical protein
MNLLDKIGTAKDWYGKTFFKPKISDMLGVTFTEVKQDGSYELQFVCEEGVFTFYHDQDCCEDVDIQDVTGDLQDLVGEPLLVAEESTGETPADFKFKYEPDSYTWTFYKFATRKGYVDVRWLGESNGYYSESVSLQFVPKMARDEQGNQVVVLK